MRIALTIMPLNPEGDAPNQVISDIGRRWRLEWLAAQATGAELSDWSCGVLNRHSTHGRDASLAVPTRVAFFVGRVTHPRKTLDEMFADMEALVREVKAAISPEAGLLYLSELGEDSRIGMLEKPDG